MIVNKWNYNTQAYDKVEKNISTILFPNVGPEIPLTVQCMNCEKEIDYWNCYTSKVWHTGLGLGYPVCEDCYNQELNNL